MKYEEAGTYELTYKAVDECGNEAQQTRTIEVTAKPELKTVLFEDGYLLINVLSTDIPSISADHGNVTNEYEPAPYNFVNQSDIPWFNEKNNIMYVSIANPVKQTSCKRLFNALYYVQEIDLTNLDTSECTDMSQMFSGCVRLINIDGIGFDTSNVTDMQMMFYECKSLETVNLYSFDTSKVTNMQQMFRNDAMLYQIYASDKFVTNQVTNSNAMFLGCTALSGAISYDPNVTDKTYANLQGYFSTPEWGV